jgi:aquaglyceroporin related protein
MTPYQPRPQQGDRQHTMETVHESQSKQTNSEHPQTNSRPTAPRRPTAKSRPTYASMARQPTQNTLQEHGLAGPPAYSKTQRREDTHYDEGYEDANPWMQEQDDDAGFSLAGNFPRTVRWKNKKDDGSHEKVEANKKGATEVAPQVQEAEDQGNGDDHDPVDDASSIGEEESIKRQKFEAQQQGGNLQASRTMSHHTTFPQYAPNTRPFNWWAGFRMRHQRPLAEFLGMVVFMFLGISANLSVYVSQDKSGSQQTVWWTWGFAVMIGIYIAGGSSGAFLNPMVVMVLAVFRGFPARRIPVYILVQILGAFIGSLLAFAVYRDSIMNLDGALLPETTGVNFYTQPQADYISVHTAFIVEMLGSAVIACTILALGDSGNSPPGAGMHAFIIGLLITTTCMALGWTTRGCFNPARDLGPRLAALAVGYPLHSFTDWSNFWIWGAWCAPMVGGLIGGVAYDACVFKGGESPINYSGGLWKKKALQKESDFFAHVMRNNAKAVDIDRRLESGELQTVESSAAHENDLPPEGHEQRRSGSGSESAESRKQDDMMDAYLASRFNRTE